MPGLRRAVGELWRSARLAAPRLPPTITSPAHPSLGSRAVPPVEQQQQAPASNARSLPEFDAGRKQQQPEFDEWSCLHDLQGKEAQRLLREEAAAEKSFFADTAEFERQLQAEATRLLLPEDEAPPERHGGYLYYQRHTAEGFAVHCRRRALAAGSEVPHPGSVEEVLLDTSKLASEAGTGFAEVAHCKVSDDHSVLAYVVDVVGDESYELRFRGLGDRCFDWSARFPGVRSVEFTGHGSAETGLGVLIVRADPQTQRACRISLLTVALHHMPAADPLRATSSDASSSAAAATQTQLQASEVILWDEEEAAAYLEVFRTKDRKVVLLSSNTKDTSEVRVVRCGSRADAPDHITHAHRLLPRREGVEYFAEHHQDTLFVISNHERPDFKVYSARDETIFADRADWSSLAAFFEPPGGLHVTDADMMARHLVLYGHDAAEPKVCVVPLDGAAAASKTEGGDGAVVGAYLAQLPGHVGAVEPGVNAESEADSVRFTFRTPLDAGSTFDLRLDGGELQPVSSRQWYKDAGIAASMFQCDRVEYPSRDGALVPMTLARARERGGSGKQPCLLYVYGAYGSCLEPDFRVENMALLRRGWTIAWAHVRGGGECGRAWHAAGRQLSKAQSVLDLSDALRFLIARGIAEPGALCVKTASAGGLTLGALLNSPAEAQKVAAAILEVPFVDPLTGMSDPSLPLTVHEFSEWGDPSVLKHRRNLQSLSPYENVGTHRYPPLYLSCSMADTRVPAWMPLKYTSRLRARAPGYMELKRGGARRNSAPEPERAGTGAAVPAAAPVAVLHCADSGGHGGAADWHGRSEEFARQIAFLHKAVGLPLQ
eukprot:TRINITY_DN47703_c0_g1_i1.p1 TRINITY_DN47703_c0_g1~~TRINITY_DN47703_c0_g1_i1.p1  ORF type:complete len:830 (+),score=188.16 TRINITY_DN47703_c0_g1_i1:73-2562(+)